MKKNLVAARIRDAQTRVKRFGSVNGGCKSLTATSLIACAAALTLLSCGGGPSTTTVVPPPAATVAPTSTPTQVPTATPTPAPTATDNAHGYTDRTSYPCRTVRA